MMRNKIVAGNWKMNLSLEEAIALHQATEENIIQEKSDCMVYQFAPSIYLLNLQENSKNIKIGAQNAYPQPKGAFTGEISMKQLAAINVNSILIGHSERRQLFNETDEFLKAKVDAALQEKMEIFFCCGETLEERVQNKEEEKILSQLKNSLFHLSPKDFESVIIAYEPIWAIGTGKTASPEEANNMHRYIRNVIAENYSSEVAENTSIIYGGSCKPDNAVELFKQTDIDGGLIGGASLKAADFYSIISSI